MNHRRKLVIALGASALALPFSAFPQQQGKVWRVGFLAPRPRPTLLESDVYGAFALGMRELGYVEGKNLDIEWRFAEGRAELLPVLAAELVRLKVDVIVAAASQAISAAQKAISTIPIVMGLTGDPVGNGFVKSLAHPGGNITGLSIISDDLSPKHLEMLLSMGPKIARVAVLVNPNSLSNRKVLMSVQAVAPKVGVKIVPVEARSPKEIEDAFSTMTRENVKAVIVVPDSTFFQQLRQIAELSAKNRLLSIHASREFADAGGLMSYGPNNSENYRRAATYVDKILKGAKPADLPVEQPTKFELFINGKTAKALGLKIPQSLLIMADKVIE